MAGHIPDAALHHAIGLVYDSALDPAVWPTALEAMAGLIGGCSSGIMVHDPARREIRLAMVWNNLPDWPKWRRLFEEKYAAIMPFYESLAKFEIGAVHNTADMADMVGLKDYYQHAFFQEWAFPSGLRDNIACVLMKSANRFATFTIHTSTERDLIGPRELAVGRLLVPHVRRAVVVGDLLNMTASTASILQATLDTLSAAVVVTDAEGRVIHSNKAGDAMLRTDDLLGTEDGVLRAGQPQATQALLLAIGQTDAPVDRIGSNGIGVPLRHTDGSPAIAHVLPLARGGTHRDWGPRATAAVFVAPVEYAPPTADALIALYGLTAMEARVMMQIAAGRKRAEAAAVLGIANSTTKTNLDRVFGKTGTKDQAGLARLVLALASPARRNE